MLSGEPANLQSEASNLAQPRLSIGRIAAAQNRVEPRDYADFFRLEFPSVLRTVELMLRDHARAEEIAQDAFVQLLLRWSKISRYERPDSWVRRVAIRLAIRSLRRDELWRRVREALLPSEPVPSRYDLDGAIRRLSPAQRAAVVLHYYEDRSTAEIASSIGCSESTARVHLHHARKRLAQLLEEDDRVD